VGSVVARGKLETSGVIELNSEFADHDSALLLAMINLSVIYDLFVLGFHRIAYRRPAFGVTHVFYYTLWNYSPFYKGKWSLGVSTSPAASSTSYPQVICTSLPKYPRANFCIELLLA